MSWYIVTAKRQVYDTKLVEADSEEEALVKFADGNEEKERLDYTTGETSEIAVEGGPYPSPEAARGHAGRIDGSPGIVLELYVGST